jgi:hypothetical protein
MESLDQTGRLLYDSYITTRDAWISYIRPRAITRLNSYLASTGRIYPKYEYYTNTTQGFMKDKSIPVAKPKSHAMVAKYKKLCILFHPDKFNHSSSTDLFHLLKKWFDSNNLEMLDILDYIAHLILEIPPSNELHNLLANLANRDILDIVKSNCRDMEDAICIFDLLNSDITKLCSNSNACTSSNENMKPENFINTNAYKFFMNEESIRLQIEEQALTEWELIDYIKQQGKYNDAFLAFYGERYRDNENILRVVAELQMQRNEELKKENERLRSQINRLSIKE